MREKREFAKRSGKPESREVLKKFFLVYEGENTEDIYAGLETQVDNDTIHGIKLITRQGCERICDFAFQYALKNNRKEVGVVTKANISKLANILHRLFFRFYFFYVFNNIQCQFVSQLIGSLFNIFHCMRNFYVFIVPTS